MCRDLTFEGFLRGCWVLALVKVIHSLVEIRPCPKKLLNEMDC